MKARKHPFVISVRHPDGKVNYLAGHESKDGKGMETICLFTDQPADAISSMDSENLRFGWPSLLSSHCRTMGIKAEAIIHQVNKQPQWEDNS